MMNMNLRAQGAAFVANKTQNNPRDLVVMLVEEKPNDTREQLFDEFRKLIEGDDDYQRVIDWYFFVNMHSYLLGTRSSPRSPQEREQRQEAARERVTELKRKIVNVVLLDLQMPNGKLLRDSTFAECAKAGGWFSKLAKKGKPNQVVGKLLTEADLKALK